MEIYKSLATPPKSALKEIQGGKLKGFSDINPQWRYEIMTEKFGLVGLGWKYEVQRLWTENGSGGEVLCFAQVAVFVRDPDTKEWSDAIVGIGGSKLVNFEKGNLISNDEGYKMAVTDAFSTSLKMLGVAADVYAGLWDGSKYRKKDDEIPETVKNIQKAVKGEVVSVLAGGETTPEQKKRITELVAAKYPDGTDVFGKEAMKAVCEWRKTKTAQQVIEYFENELKKRLAEKKETDNFPDEIPF